MNFVCVGGLPMKKSLALILTLCLVLPGLALAQSADDMIRKGNDYMDQGDYVSAAISLDIAQKLGAEELSILAALSRLKSLQGDHAGALADIEAALAMEPANGDLYLMKAEALKTAGNIAEAEIALQYAAVCGAQIPVQTAAEPSDSEEDSSPAGEAIPAEDTNPIAQAIKTGSVSLVSYTPDFSGFYYSCSRAWYEANKSSMIADIAAEATADGQRMLIAPVPAEESEDFSIVSLSPSGKTGLWEENGAFYAAVDGELRLFTPNYDRGAHNEGYEEENFGIFEHFGYGLDPEGIVWSPDERYFAITAANCVDSRDLIIGDVLTGDLFLTEATPVSLSSSKGAQALRALTAAFDPEGRYVYYATSVLFGTITLRRYDMTSGQVEELICFDGNLSVLRNLTVGADGTLYAVANFKDSDAQLLTCREQNGSWVCETTPIAKVGHMNLVQKYLASSLSGHAIALGSQRGASGATYPVLNGTALPIPENGSLIALAEDTVDEGNRGLQTINLTLSPDGRFAMAAVNLNREMQLRLMDLDTLSSAVVIIPEDMNLNVAIPNSNVTAAFAWNGDGSLILHLDGENRLCSLQLP